MLWCSATVCDALDVFRAVDDIFFGAVLLVTSPLQRWLDVDTAPLVPLATARAAAGCWLWAEFVHGAVALALFCVFLVGAVRAADAVAMRHWPAYRNLPNRNRQLYVLVNLSKASCLAVMFFSRTWVTDVYEAFALGQWGTVGTRRLMRVKHIAAFYVATDVVALWIVPRLPRTTVVHHYVSWLLALCIFGTDVRQPQATVVRMILLYGAWSTVPYAVNAFLALRRVYDDGNDDDGDDDDGDGNNASKGLVRRRRRRCMEALAAFALVVYAVACACNWLWHVHWFIDQVARGFASWYDAHDASMRRFFVEPPLVDWAGTAGIALYAMSVVMLARDDLILMQWLWARARQNGCVDFVVQSADLVRTLAWHTCTWAFSRPLRHITAEHTEHTE